MTNPFNVEKTAQKYQQLAKDALTSGDPVFYENYLQHAEHFNRRLAELNVKPKEQKIESSNLLNHQSEPLLKKKKLFKNYLFFLKAASLTSILILSTSNLFLASLFKVFPVGSLSLCELILFPFLITS